VITVVGSLNVDLVVNVPHFPCPGETVRGTNHRRTCGGKGANQAVAVARMGMPVALIGAVGCDSFGEELLANLAGSGVDNGGILSRPGVPTGTAMITLDAAGQNQIVVAGGANDTLTAPEMATLEDWLPESRALLLQLEIPLEAVFAAAERAHQHGVPVFLNVAPFAPVPEALLRLSAWIIANESEAAQLSGLPVTSIGEAALAAAELRRRVPTASIAITLGPDGVWIDSPDFTGQVPGFRVTIVDTVGAGDTWIGAFAARILEGVAAVEAARFANAAAALAVTRRGAQSGIPRRAEVEELLRPR
jgi:ribokinase